MSNEIDGSFIKDFGYYHCESCGKKILGSPYQVLSISGVWHEKYCDECSDRLQREEDRTI